MKRLYLILFFLIGMAAWAVAQDDQPDQKRQQDIEALKLLLSAKNWSSRRLKHKNSGRFIMNIQKN
jgi:hypothetical protein